MASQTIEEQITAWVADRPAWQRWVFKQIAAGTPADTELAQRVADLLVSNADFGDVAVAVSEIPGAAAADGAVNLLGVRGVTNVNALSPGQHLKFSATGITVIYGNNGSGKSGYARLVKDAVGGRHPEDVRVNVFEPEAARAPQAATIEFEIGSIPGSAAWPAEKPHELRAVSFYDEHCGELYLKKESELVFRPSSLELLDRLIATCDLTREILDRRIARENTGRMALPVLPEGTGGHAFLRKLSGHTTPAEIVAATDVGEGASDRMLELTDRRTKLDASNPKKERDSLNALVGAARRTSEACASIETRLGGAAVQQLDLKTQAASDARQIALTASTRSFEDLPLTAVGSASWRGLWEAARQFSVETYPEHSFPHTESGARCVLCHQQLDDAAAARFERFDAFIADQTEQQARRAESARDQVVGQIRDFTIRTPAIAVDVERLRSVDEELANEVDDFLKTAEEARVAALEAARPIAPSLPAGLTTKLTLWANLRGLAAAEISDGSFATDLADVTRELDELHAKQTLAGLTAEIEAEVKLRREISRLDKLRSGCETMVITKKCGALEAAFVTATVQDQFIRETERLNLTRIQLKKTGGRKGRSQIRPDLLGASAGSVIDVLSEGEQKALSLAGYFTEAAFDQSKSALVFDDPVTSLDHVRRPKVAARLIELAAERQVIVFTHDMAFVRDLRSQAEAQSVALLEQAISRQGTTKPGIVSDQHPWAVKDAAGRLQSLTEQLARLKKEREQLNEDEYAKRAASLAGELSQVWERIVSNEFVYEAFNPGKSEVQPAKLKILARFTEEDNEEYQVSYKRISGWAARHDQAIEINYTPPEPAELEGEIAIAKAFFLRVKSYRR